ENCPDEAIYQARRDVGMVFQNPDNPIVATIVEEDVAFGPENLGIPSDEIRQRVDEALDLVGMKEYARHHTHRLSGGQKQRIAIAGVLAMRRKCVIFDESTAMLDPIGRKEVLETILRMNREEKITVILITHYMNEAMRADRILVMDHGRIVMDGAPKEIFSDPQRLWDVGLDVPQTTEVLFRLRQAGLEIGDLVLEPEGAAEEVVRAVRKGGRA
ncbi:MAG: ATP-binding cassette domain-containing protein, partial [Clostridia bacterium]|nr:ATP-binding cassette domain-containing protein [Clostridia bacterium]